PELTPLPQARRQEILARCADDPTMRSIARRHVMLMRAGWAILPVGLIASLVLWRAGADPRVMIGVLVAAPCTAIAWIAGSVLRYHCRSSAQLRSLVRAAVARHDETTS
ncbi:MAG TPA: hypothetical protein VH475_10325, partial [Tepidisphaeraceae bacterium]